MKGDLDGAIEDYTKAIEIDPKNETYYHSRGVSRYLKKDLKGAIEDMRKTLRVAAPNWKNRKAVEGSLKKMQEALQKKKEE